MKVLFIGRSLRQGGAAIAMQRLAASLRETGSKVEVIAPGEEGGEAFALSPGERWLGRLLWPCGLDHLHTQGSFRLAKDPWLDSFDLIHLHNLHAGYFNYLALPRLSRRLPVVWTLHDMWAFTGHCGYSMECERWKTGCGSCPHLTAYPYMARDASHLEWRLKRWSYRRSRLQVAAPSRWLAEAAGRSILGGQSVHHVPYGLDLDQWQPMDRPSAREHLGIPREAIVLLAIADDLSEPRKGGHYLLDVLGRLPDSIRERCLILTAGRGSPEALQASGLRIHHAGYLGGDAEKRALYSAADLTLFTSSADNLPLVLMESMACGVPAIAFEVGGVPDLVQSGLTGSLVAPFDCEAFAREITALIGNPERRMQLGASAREQMIQGFGSQREAAAYRQIYDSALAGRAVGKQGKAPSDDFPASDRLGASSRIR